MSDPLPNLRRDLEELKHYAAAARAGVQDEESVTAAVLYEIEAAEVAARIAELEGAEVAV